MLNWSTVTFLCVETNQLWILPFQAGATITWDLVVGGWDLEYGAEYVPAADGGYTLCVERTKKVPASADEPVHNAFTAKEAGKMVLSIDNSGSRKRKVAAYRYFVRKPSV